jgi:hypothetical protein
VNSPVDAARQHIPFWLHALVRLDFVAAVVLTVVAPLVLLARALWEGRQEQLAALLGYWRASSLLMVTVYLLVGERRWAFVCGVAARLLIPWSLRNPVPDAHPWYEWWRRVASGYCLLGVALTAPMLRCAACGKQTTLCRAYVEPTQEFAALLHPGQSRERLGRVGDLGLRAFVVGGALLGLRRAWHLVIKGEGNAA